MNTVSNYFMFSPKTRWFKLAGVSFGWDASCSWARAERRIWFGLESWRGTQRAFHSLHLWPFSVNWSTVNHQQPAAVRAAAKKMTDGCGIQF